MRVKATTLYFFICSLGNILHVYQICDEYLRYDVTTNVQVTVPEHIDFPSITICVDLMDSLNWSAFSLDTRRQLIASLDVNESSVFLKDPSSVLPEMQLLTPDQRSLVFNELVNMLTVSEIMNVTAPLHDVISSFTTSTLAYNDSLQEFFSKGGRLSNGLVRLFTREAVEIQFIVNMTYTQRRYKCFTLRLRPELNKLIPFDDLVSRHGDIFFTFRSHYNRLLEIYLSSDGYLTRLTGSWLNVSPGRQLGASFVTHESILLEYPYKTNCIDYTKIGLLSRHQCRYACFKSLTIRRFNRIFEQLYAHDSDNIHLRPRVVSNDSISPENIPEDIVVHCHQSCFGKECRDVSQVQFEIKQVPLSSVYGDFCALNDTRNCKLWQETLEYELHVEDKPGTRTETQAAIPLISFLTGLLSTFGIWLGLSAFGCANIIQMFWMKTRKNKRLNLQTQQAVARISPLQQPTSHSIWSWKKSQR